MKILILVLSYNEGVFADFMKAQQATWDLERHPDVDVVYYYGGAGINVPCESNYNGECKVACSDDYEMMHWKFRLALGAIKYYGYDLIFRTNSCSYIDKEKLIEVAKTLPRTNCYAGYDNGTYVSGAGIFFSPDVLDILWTQLKETPHGAEDVLIGEILNGRVPIIAENSRVDATVDGVDLSTVPETAWHYRFKTSNHHPDRVRDIKNMYKLHNELKA